MKHQVIHSPVAMGARSFPSGRSGTGYARWGKRAFDIALAVILLPVLLPVILALAGVVALDGGAPFFGHRRVGKGGRGFHCWKIRTMVADAQEHLAQYLDENPVAAEEWALKHKLDHDPRITKLGRFLRRSSLDELPQIFNVLRGEMSFVGPRPVEREELRRYGLSAGIYKSLRPGITGKWQVSGRSNVAYDKRVALDVAYAKKMSWLGDIVILFKTLTTVAVRSGR
ncbi:MULTISPECIES: sugar transferase [unclassified Sulfitobacter]|uniref:sugar transferase n=1 Tax=unclassified Sulfitobacter TaxID=196795 RepID=UPI003744EDA7